MKLIIKFAIAIICIIAFLGLITSRSHKARKHKRGTKINKSHQVITTTTTSSVVSNSLTLDPKCGCEIVMSYFEHPKVIKRLPYTKRWPDVKHEPKVEIPKVPLKNATCVEAQGEQLYAALASIFPSHVLRDTKKPKASGTEGSVTSSGVATTSDGSIADMKKLLGEFGDEIMTAAKRLGDQISKDEIDAKGPVRKSPIKSSGKALDDVKPKPLTVAEIEKAKREVMKNKFEAKARSDCKAKLRNLLNPKVQGQYKKPKCWVIGRVIKRCTE